MRYPKEHRRSAEVLTCKADCLLRKALPFGVALWGVEPLDHDEIANCRTKPEIPAWLRLSHENHNMKLSSE